MLFKTLLLMVMSVTVSQSRPQQDVEFVTSMENIALDDSLEATTDNILPESSDLGDESEAFMLIDEDPVANTTPEESATDSYDDTETATEVVVDNEVISNVVDTTQELVLAEEKEVTLVVRESPDSVVVFRETDPILGLNCDASSQVDNDIKYMWTKNGRFIDTDSAHVTFESQEHGNIIIYSPDEEDEGVYQCVVSNSEGVVFSRVSKVKMLSPRLIAPKTRARALDTDKVTIYLPVNNNGKFTEEVEENVYLVMPSSEEK